MRIAAANNTAKVQRTHRSFTAMTAKNARNIAKIIAFLSHRSIAASHRIIARSQPRRAEGTTQNNSTRIQETGAAAMQRNLAGPPGQTPWRSGWFLWRCLAIFAP